METIVAQGVNGQLELHDTKIVIKRKGFLSKLTQGLAGDKEIAIRNISSVQIKKPGLTNGYIQFTFMGGQEHKGNIFETTKDENSVMFNKKNHPDFIIIKDEIENRNNEAFTPQQQQSSISEADELEKLASLKDKGILSEEEFSAMKKKVLGL